jgi:hypothetical protein
MTMGALFLALLKFVGGDALKTVVGAVAGYFQTRANTDLAQYQTGVAADTQVALARINAEIELSKQQAAMLAADRGWWVTAWIRPLVAYPLVVHFGAVVVDTTFRLDLNVPPLPGEFSGYEHDIILSFFIVRSLEKVARVFSTRGGSK